MPRTIRRRSRRNRRVNKGGMYRAPSENRKSMYQRQREVGDKSSSRPISIQDKLLAQIAKQTAAPVVLSPYEKRLLNMLKRRTPAEINNQRKRDRLLSTKPLLPTLARMERQQDFIKELRSVAPQNKKVEFDRLITNCDRDRELLKQFINENLSQEDGVMRMKQSHHEPLLNRNLYDIKIIGELKDIVNRCSRNRIELMNIIRDVYPQLSDILTASGVVNDGVAKYLEDPHQPGYGFIKGALDKLNIQDDNDLFDILRDPFGEDFENNELLESGYMENGRWIKRSSPENTRFLPRMNYGTKKKRRSKNKVKRKISKSRRRRRSRKN